MTTEHGTMYWIRNRHGAPYIRVHRSDCPRCAMGLAAGLGGGAGLGDETAT